jgi:hypothetical protein
MIRDVYIIVVFASVKSNLEEVHTEIWTKLQPALRAFTRLQRR